MNKIQTTPITEKEKMAGNIQLIDMLNHGIKLKPEELMDISHFLIESRRAYDPAINYSNSRAPFVDKNKIFEDKRKEFLKEKAERAATEYIQNEQNRLYDLAVKEYRQKNHIKEGQELPIDAKDEIESVYLPSIINEAYSITYKSIIKKPLTEDELTQIADYVKEYKIEPTKDIDEEIYNELMTGDIPSSETFDVSPALLKKHLFFVSNTKDEKAKNISITDEKAYTGKDKENFQQLNQKIKDNYYHPKFCYKDMKQFVNGEISPIFNFAKLYPNTNSYAAYRIGDFVFNRDDYDLKYENEGGYNAWDSGNNVANNPFNFSFEDYNKVTSDYDTSYPIGSVVYSGNADVYLPNKPESDTNVYPRHVTAIAAQVYDPQADIVASLANDYGMLRKFNRPVSGFELSGVYTPNDVAVLFPRDEYKYVTFSKYYTPETIENLKKQLEQNNMNIGDFFQKLIKSVKPNLEPPLNIPLTLHPRKKQ